jgi:hypothetical protein
MGKEVGFPVGQGTSPQVAKLVKKLVNVFITARTLVQLNSIHVVFL